METRTNDVLKALNGDNAAMERLYNETYPKLRAVTASILKNEDDAEDIIQDTYIKAFSTLKQLDDASKFDAWLCRIASNKCKDYLKKHKPVLFSDMGNGDEDEDPYEWSIEDESGAYNPEEVAITDDTRRQLMELINSLPDEQRICLVYYAVEEMKISEIAQMMEVSESTVKSRLKYAKDKMKTKIEELEKKGVKIRSVSGFALIPFLHYLFATEAKAATAISFSAISEAVAAVAKASSTATTTSASTVAKTVVTEVAKQTGAKAAVGLGTKIAALPLVAKIAAGVVAVCVAVGVPIAVNKITSSDNSSSNGAENIVATEKSFDILNEQIVFEETVILDEEDFMIKVLDIIIDGEYDYSLEVEITNKSDKPYEFNISQSYINGVLLSNYDKLMLNCEIEANSTEIEEIVFRNRDILDCLQKISEIKLNFSVGNTPGDDDFEYDDYFKDYEATPIYPYGKNNAKEFKIGNNYNRIIYSDSKVAAYLLPKSEQFDGQGDFRLTFFVENNTGSRVFFGTNDCEINDTEIEQLNRNYGIGVSKKTKMFYSMIFRKEELIKNNIFEVEKVSFDAVVENTKGDELFNENIVLVFKNVEKTATPEQVKEAIDARHKVLITAFGIDNWRNRADITSIIEDNLDLVLKVAPEEVWRNISFVSADSSLVDIVKAQIYTHYEYIMPGYNYNAGIGFDINYEVVGVVKMSDDELSSFCDEINRNKGNEDVIITNVYDEIPLYAGNYLKSETITECYKTTVEYVLTGQKKTFKRKKTYNVVKSGDNWYCLDGISFSLRWDLPFEEQLSKDWQP